MLPDSVAAAIFATNRVVLFPSRYAVIMRPSALPACRWLVWCMAGPADAQPSECTWTWQDNKAALWTLLTPDTPFLAPGLRAACTQPLVGESRRQVALVPLGWCPCV